MEKSKAKQILNDSFDTVNTTKIKNHSEYVDADKGDQEIALDGQFTADQLEALAMWMRDSESVIGN